jgi:hypothetical protein
MEAMENVMISKLPDLIIRLHRNTALNTSQQRRNVPCIAPYPAADSVVINGMR